MAVKPPLRRLTFRLWWLISSVSVRTKIMGIVLSMVLLFALGVIFQLQAVWRQALIHELEEHGVSVARDLAARSTDLILTNNLFALHELLQETLESNDDMRYVFILDSRGEVLVHSFGTGFPPDLRQANTVRSDEPVHLEILDTEEGLIWDFAVPIFEGKAGIARVGMSEHLLNEMVAATTRRLLLATALVSLLGVVAAYLLTKVLTKPILELVEVTKAVVKGDLRRRVRPWANDEIGQLSTAFNAMIEDLERSHQELLRRNRELAALNAVAAAVNGSLDLDQVLERSLDKVLEATGLKAGWIRMVKEEGQHSELVCYAGLTEEIAQREAAVDPELCACWKVVETRAPVIIGPLSDTCPVLDADLGEGKRAACYATVPIMAKSQVLGTLNVASHDPDQFSAEDLQLLDAIGHQIGVAIENALLWEELKKKEELRGQLLERVITAQEEERHRIARELHDETGQSLTSLMVGLKALEEATTLEEVKERTAELRAIASNTLREVHHLALELRPSILDDMGLVAALQQYAKEYEGRFDIALDFEIIGFDERRLPPHMETALYRIVQEALTNIAKHAEARNVSVLLVHKGTSVVAIVEDDGKGFDVARVLGSKTREMRLGLYSMQERASLIGGKLTIESRPGVGTTIFAEVPLDAKMVASGRYTNGQ